MRDVSVRELSVEGFMPYGTYAGFNEPSSEKIGESPVEFFRDMLQINLETANSASFSICRVGQREMIIATTEYHTGTAEGLMPIDNDVLIHVAPATPPNASVPLDRIAVYRVPKATMVILRPGVWHYAPFPVEPRPANVLIVLPERAYANDCRVVELCAEERLRIAFQDSQSR